MKQKIALFIFTSITLTSFSAEKSPPTLKSVMQGLAKSMDRLNQGIFYEDFKLIEKAAYNIAVHPRPKTQLPTVIKTLNIRIFKFKAIDSKVHSSAMGIVEFAKGKDMAGVLRKHKVIMNSCVSCHTQFKDELSKALSEK